MPLPPNFPTVSVGSCPLVRVAARVGFVVLGREIVFVFDRVCVAAGEVSAV